MKAKEAKKEEERRAKEAKKEQAMAAKEAKKNDPVRNLKEIEKWKICNLMERSKGVEFSFFF